MKINRISIEATVVLLLCGMAHATIWYVHPDSALNSIQGGIDLCTTGDTVLVAPGTYIENINFNGLAIRVMSEYGRDTTIIDGSNPSHADTGSVVLFINGEDTNSVLEGFTITSGTGTYIPSDNAFIGGGIYCHGSSPTITGNIVTENTTDYGAGVECEFASSPVITDNIITKNKANFSSGGIECYVNSSPYIEGNVIENDTAFAGGGGGIQCYDNCSPDIINNTISNNFAGSWGGGIRCGNFSSAFIKGNLISGNRAIYEGGGIECDGNSSPTIISNTITGDSAGHGGGIQCDLNASPDIDSCTITYNSGDGIWSEQGSNPMINDSDIFGNWPYGVRNIDPGIMINAESNWWGDPSGPGGSGPGFGDSVSDYVDYTPWRTSPGIGEFESAKPFAIALQVNPNPFRHSTNIRFTIHDARYTIQKPALSIYDATGRLVKSVNLESSIQNQESEVKWDGTDDLNRRLASGVYFVVFSADRHSETRKVLKIR